MKRPQTLIVVAPVVIAVLAALMLARGDQRSATIAAPVPASLAIEPFTIAQPTTGWDKSGFVDTLAKVLNGVAGFRAEVSRNGGSTFDFILRGTVRPSDARLVIAIQLMERSAKTPTWSSTYWRTDAQLPALAQEMATGVAEAVYANIARRAVTTAAKEKQ